MMILVVWLPLVAGVRQELSLAMDLAGLAAAEALDALVVVDPDSALSVDSSPAGEPEGECDVDEDKLVELPDGVKCSFATEQGEDGCKKYYFNAMGDSRKSPCVFKGGVCLEKPGCAGSDATTTENMGVTGLGPTLEEQRRDCDNRHSCGTCAESDGCGWCSQEDRGEGQGTCVMGGPSGPLDEVSGRYGKEQLHLLGCTSWEFSFCPASPCRSHKDCAACLADSFCGWCSSSSTCTEGDIAGPIAGLSDACRRGWQHAVVPHSSSEDFGAVMTFDTTATHNKLKLHCETVLDETRELVRMDIEHEAKQNATWRYEIQRCSPCDGQWPDCDCGGNIPKSQIQRPIKVLRKDDEATMVVEDAGSKDVALEEAKKHVAEASSSAAMAAAMVNQTYAGLVDAKSKIPTDPEQVARLTTAYTKAQQLLESKQNAYKESTASLSLVSSKTKNIKALADEWSGQLKAEAAAVNAKALAEKNDDPDAVRVAQALIDAIAERAADAELALKVATTSLDGSGDDEAARAADRQRTALEKLALHSSVLNALSATMKLQTGMDESAKAEIKDVMKPVIVDQLKAIKDHSGGEVDPASIQTIRESIGFPETREELAGEARRQEKEEEARQADEDKRAALLAAAREAVANKKKTNSATSGMLQPADAPKTTGTQHGSLRRST